MKSRTMMLGLKRGKKEGMKEKKVWMYSRQIRDLR